MIQNNATAHVADRVSLYLGILSIVISAVSLTVVIMSVADLKDHVVTAEMETRLLDDWLQEHGVVKENGKFTQEKARVP